MGDQPTTITRSQLYERIWKTPIVQLGKELGLSYVEMLRLCERYQRTSWSAESSHRDSAGGSCWHRTATVIYLASWG